MFSCSLSRKKVYWKLTYRMLSFNTVLGFGNHGNNHLFFHWLIYHSGNAPSVYSSQSGASTGFPHSHWRYARSLCLGLLVDAGKGLSSSLDYGHEFCSSCMEVKRLDFTDEVTRSHVDPSCSFSSATTVLLRFVNVFYASLLTAKQFWAKMLGGEASLREEEKQKEGKTRKVLGSPWNESVFICVRFISQAF